jgi:hypothetical protein
MNFEKLAGLKAPILSIGGAGTFDGIFLTGIVAVLIASIPSRRREVGTRTPIGQATGKSRLRLVLRVPDCFCRCGTYSERSRCRTLKTRHCCF